MFSDTSYTNYKHMETLKDPFQCPQKLTNVIQTSQNSPWLSLRSLIFFPRVRTPCGHGAQVIVEGREEQTDGGERNKDPKTNPKPNTQARRPKLHQPDKSQTVAAIPSERSLQLRVNRAQPPRGEANPAPFGTHRCH